MPHIRFQSLPWPNTASVQPRATDAVQRRGKVKVPLHLYR
jgi:hypothetical protein